MGSPYVPLKGGQFGHTHGSDRGAAVPGGDAVDDNGAENTWCETNIESNGSVAPKLRRCRIVKSAKNFAVGALQVQVFRPASAAADCEIRVELSQRASWKISPSIAAAIPSSTWRPRPGNRRSSSSTIWRNAFVSTSRSVSPKKALKTGCLPRR
jgi:hypothetical protein